MLNGKTILVGITGGIAAYKTCELIRLYKKNGANVRVVVTPNALNFVTKLTLQTLSCNEVYVENFEINEYKPEHIALTEADIFVIAPASANTISKISNGICDNLLLSTVCAFSKPVLIAPAMNNNMWENPFVQENIQKLEKAGYYILEPSEGFLACGTNGTGRMKEPKEIFDKTLEILTMAQSLKGKKILITAGGTREKIDPVRFITNASSGKMGLALAKIAEEKGADVTLISTFTANIKGNNIVVETAKEMKDEVLNQLKDSDILIMSAAVSDYRVKEYSEQKIKKINDTITIELVKNPDILKNVCDLKKQKNLSVKIVGFCAESENLLENAKTKIQTKGCDYIVANDISRRDIGFNSDENEIYIINKNLDINHIEKSSKRNIACKILETVFE